MANLPCPPHPAHPPHPPPHVIPFPNLPGKFHSGRIQVIRIRFVENTNQLTLIKLSPRVFACVSSGSSHFRSLQYLVVLKNQGNGSYLRNSLHFVRVPRFDQDLNRRLCVGLMVQHIQYYGYVYPVSQWAKDRHRQSKQMITKKRIAC